MTTSFADLSPSHPLNKWLFHFLSCFNQMKQRERGFQNNYIPTRSVKTDSSEEERAGQRALLVDKQADLGRGTALAQYANIFVVLRDSKGTWGEVGLLW